MRWGSWPARGACGFASSDVHRGVPPTESGPPGSSFWTGRCPNGSGAGDRQSPGGSFFFLKKKGIEQCDSSRYSAPWHDANAWADNTAYTASANTSGDHPEAHVPVCDAIDAAGAGRGDECPPGAIQ